LAYNESQGLSARDSQGRRLRRNWCVRDEVLRTLRKPVELDSRMNAARHPCGTPRRVAAGGSLSTQSMAACQQANIRAAGQSALKQNLCLLFAPCSRANWRHHPRQQRQCSSRTLSARPHQCGGRSPPRAIPCPVVTPAPAARHLRHAHEVAPTTSAASSAPSSRSGDNAACQVAAPRGPPSGPDAARWPASQPGCW